MLYKITAIDRIQINTELILYHPYSAKRFTLVLYMVIYRFTILHHEINVKTQS